MYSPQLDPRRPVALIDLGDTLAECTVALQAELEQTCEPHSPAELLEARTREVLTTPGFWSRLQPRAAGFSLLELLQEAGFHAFVLTKGPRDAPQVWADKVAWCRRHVPDLPVIVTDDKSPVRGNVLVDDWLPYVDSWQQSWPSSLVIVPAQPWNAQMSVGPLRMRDDGLDRAEISAALARQLRS
jgi:hypothetical protein